MFGLVCSLGVWGEGVGVESFGDWGWVGGRYEGGVFRMIFRFFIGRWVYGGVFFGKEELGLRFWVFGDSG